MRLFLNIPVLLIAAVSFASVDELMPIPKAVERTGGESSVTVLDRCVIERCSVDKAPKDVAAEAYVLEISSNGVRIVASDDRGVRYARVTLDQLRRLSVGGFVENCRITDWPTFRYRGFMLDTARNYLPIEIIKEMVDGMARYKMNLFHWHLSENYAWRLESKRYPQLQDEKAFFLRYPGRYYTQREFCELVDYAAEHGIIVMPELDVPGHALAFRRGFGIDRMSDPRVAGIVAELFDELCGLVPAEKMPFVHVGGDEVWKREFEAATPTALRMWSETLARNGRTLVCWTPGEKFPSAGSRIDMHWAGAKPDPMGPPVIDANGLYIETYDPFELLPGTLFYRSCPWPDLPDEKKWGAEFCAWHDGYLGYPFENVFRNQQLFPGFVLCGNAYWSGCQKSCDSRWMRMPFPDEREFALAVDVERRTIAQRDKALKDCKRPFHFLRQSNLRWRVSHADGRLIAKDVPMATVRPFYSPTSVRNLITNDTGCVVMETWIKSPVRQDVGAWIGFTGIDRDHGLVYSAPLPRQGEWNRFGAAVELNGKLVPPPNWRRPGLEKGRAMPDWPAWTLYELDEEPFNDQEYFMREPTQIRLQKGWNHVKLTLPMNEKYRPNAHRWIGTFIPLLGTTDHPCEVPGLEYSSEPPES